MSRRLSYSTHGLVGAQAVQLSCRRISRPRQCDSFEWPGAAFLECPLWWADDLVLRGSAMYCCRSSLSQWPRMPTSGTRASPRNSDMNAAGIVSTYFQFASYLTCMKNRITSMALVHDTAIM